MKHIKTFEGFVNEGILNESQADTIARDYEALLMSDVDFDDIYLSDDGIDWLDTTLKKNFKSNATTYMTNKEFVRDSGKDWDTLIQMLKSKNVKHEVFDDEEDSVVLFER